MKIAFIVVLCVLLTGCATPTPSPTLTPAPTFTPTTAPSVTPAPGTPTVTSAPPTATATLVNVNWGVQTKKTGCVAQLPLPDSGCTPGNVDPSATVGDGSSHDICTPGYSKTVPDIPLALQDQVYAAYGVTSHAAGQYEIDHLVPVELGGNNLPGDTSNLWPEPASPIPGSHEKDTVEVYLHDQVCASKMSLHAAQVQIATNWIAIYNQIKVP